MVLAVKLTILGKRWSDVFAVNSTDFMKVGRACLGALMLQVAILRQWSYNLQSCKGCLCVLGWKSNRWFSNSWPNTDVEMRT